MGFEVTFWGVRGTVPCPLLSHMGYGGNTACVEVVAGDQRLIFDAGTGIRMLGRRMMTIDARRATLLFSHTHLDHIGGFPFFAPAFKTTCGFLVMAGHLTDPMSIHDVLSRQMEGPVFPVPLKRLASTLRFEDFKTGDTFSLGDIQVTTAALNHPGGATAYRLTHGGRSLCYVTDTEHVPGHPDQTVLGLIEGADIVIYDSTYTDATLPARTGWGHSTWQEAVRLAKAANVKRMVLFHHDPDHDDQTMAMIEREAQAQFPGCLAAREGTTLYIA